MISVYNLSSVLDMMIYFTLVSVAGKRENGSK